ncbi:MAG: sigma-54 dependent transcriptional regulator [Pseudomonadota bacterium]
MRSPANILVVDDDADVLTAARLLLRQHFTHVRTTDDPEQILELMAAEPFDVFLIDMNFAIGRNTGAEGLKWLNVIRGEDADAVVILMTAFGDLNTAVKAMREGAADFVLKPWQNDRLVATIKVAAELRQTRATVTALSEPPPVTEMIATAPAMRDVVRMIERVAPTDATVLVRGENGTGKELVAQALHQKSGRASRALVTADLGAVAETLFESELFGHRAGAFTGADRDRPGRFQAADGGSLFLDEIGNLPMPMQNKLLRALEAGEVAPLGSDRSVSVDVRLIAATNRPLEEMVERGEFREDLLYRINTIEITLPPLRERLEDLPALVERFVAQASRRHRVPARPLAAGTLDALAAHRWPGNVRELKHAVERAVILAEGDQLAAADFSLLPPASEETATTLNLEANERRLVETAIREASGNISHAASALGITRAALYRRIEKHGL